MKKIPTHQRGLLCQTELFCTECGDELENFCFSPRIDDVEAIKKKIAGCRKKGKYTGGFCAKLFVADSHNLETLWEEER